MTQGGGGLAKVSRDIAAAYFLEYMAAAFLGSVFSSIFLTYAKIGRRQNFRLNEAPELTFTK